MGKLTNPFLIKILFYVFSLSTLAVLIYISIVQNSGLALIGVTADIMGIVTFLVFSGPTISDIMRRKNQIELVKTDITNFSQDFSSMFEQVFSKLLQMSLEARKARQKIVANYRAKCDRGEITELNQEIKMGLAKEVILSYLPDLISDNSDGMLKFLVYVTSKRLGLSDVAKSIIDDLDESMIDKQDHWQYTFIHCMVLYQEQKLEFGNLKSHMKTVSQESAKDEYYMLKGQFGIYVRMKKLSQDANYRDLYEGLKEQVAEIVNKTEVSHITLRRALASEKTDLVCVIKWAEAGADVLGKKFEELGWASPANMRTIQVSPLVKTPAKEDFDLNQWIEEKFQLDEIDTPYRLVAIKFNVKDMVVRAYKRSDQFLKDVSEGISEKAIEALIFSEAESLKELMDRSDLSLLIPSETQEFKTLIRKEDPNIRADLRTKGFQQIKSPLDLRYYENQTDKIAETLKNLRTGTKKTLNADDVSRMSLEFVRNAKRLADIAL
jgi:DNA invertase Pin-like site-specific DNA recombinase